jgi:hypothetical protein
MAQGYAAETLGANAGSGFQNDGHDHRPPLGLFVHETARRPPDDSLNILDVGATIAEEIGDGLTHLIGTLVEEFLGLGGMDPASGDDFGTNHGGAVFDVDTNDDHYDAFFGKYSAVAQNA